MRLVKVLERGTHVRVVRAVLEATPRGAPVMVEVAERGVALREALVLLPVRVRARAIA